MCEQSLHKGLCSLFPLILEQVWLNMLHKICYSFKLTRAKRWWSIPPSLVMLFLRTGYTSSWSTREERSCRDAVRAWDWASLSFWPDSGSKSSEKSPAQRPSVTPDVSSGQSACGYLHFVSVCSAHTAGPLTRPREADTVVLLSLAPCRETLSRLVCWQVTLSDCLKYRSWHSSTLRHSQPDSMLLGTRPRLASPRLTNNSCLQKDAMLAWRTGDDMLVFLFAFIVHVCLNVVLGKLGKARTCLSGISWEHCIYVWMVCIY